MQSNRLHGKGFNNTMRLVSTQGVRTVLLLGMALTVALSAVFGVSSRIVQAQAANNQVTVAVGSLPLRNGPSQYADTVTQLHKGDVVTIDARNPGADWLHGTSAGQAGWVEVAYLLLPDNFSFVNLPVRRPPGGTSATAVPGATGIPNTSGGGNGNPPPVSGGGTGRGFALGGQATSLGSTAVNAMRNAGMTWVKFQYRSGDGGALGQIDAAHAQGFHILLSVIGDRGSVTNDGYQSGYASYVAGLAAHGADGIEIWNEENLDREWPAGQINPTIYVHLLAKAYNAIKSAHPSTLVISGAPSPTGAEGAFGLDHVWNDDHYYAGMAAAGAGSYVDCIGAHYNEGIVSPNQSSGDPRDNYPTRYFGAMLSRASNSFGLPVCFTELGYLTPEGYGSLPGSFGWAQKTTVAQQAQWLAQAASYAASSGRVRLLIVFNVDFSEYGADPQGGYAMIRPDGSCLACSKLGAIMGH
jgi:uncharacterized protein YraI